MYKDNGATAGRSTLSRVPQDVPALGRSGCTKCLLQQGLDQGLATGQGAQGSAGQSLQQTSTLACVLKGACVRLCWLMPSN